MRRKAVSGTSPPRKTAPQLGFRPDIEGLRGMAVLLVVAFHAGIPGLQGGFIGVDVFFVISGYLISGLLVEERLRTGRLDYLRFYARRSRRLMPAAIVTVVTTLWAAHLLLSPLELTEIGKAGLSAALSAGNLWFAWNESNYFAAGVHQNPFLHTWSLAVEEQFYLIWPVLVFGLLPFGFSRRLLTTIWIAFLSLVSFAACLWVTDIQRPWAFYGTPLRGWEFGVGALAYLGRSGIAGRARRSDIPLAWLGMAYIGAGGILLSDADAFPGWRAALPVLGTALALYALSARPAAGPGRVLATRPMQILGRLSYSWYLWHWPFLTLGHAWLGGALSLPARVTLALASLVAAAITFRLLENPVRRHHALQASNTLSLALGAALIVVGAAASIGAYAWSKRALEQPIQKTISAAVRDRPDRHCIAEFLEEEVKVCTFGHDAATSTIALMGDSHALQWLPALREAASANGWHLQTFIKSSCPAASAEIFNPTLKRPYRECSVWRRAALDRIVELRPDVIVLTNYFGYVKGAHPLDGYATLTHEEWRAALQRTLQRLAQAGIPMLVLRDNPRPNVDPVACLSRAAGRGAPLEESCRFERVRALDDMAAEVERSVVGGFDQAAYLDLTSHYCLDGQCPAYRHGMVVYRDANHLTTRYAKSLVRELEAALAVLLRQHPR